MPGVLSVLARWWAVILTCIGSSEGDPNKVASPSTKPTVAPQSSLSSVPPSIGQGRPHPVIADTHRERFLRHPSITSSDGAARGNTSSSTAGRSRTAPQARKPVQETRPEIAPAFRAHDWSSPPYRPNPPRRPPRPPSILLPAVIITPCTPDGMAGANFEAMIATPESPLDKTIAAYRIASGAAAYGGADASVRSNTTTPPNKIEYPSTYRRSPPTYGRIPGADPPQMEQANVEDQRHAIAVTPDPVEAHRNRVTGRVFVSSKLRYIVPDTTSIKFDEPLGFASSSGSSSSDQLSDTASWIYSLSFEQLASLKPLTSTPTKHRIAESNNAEPMNSEDHIFQRSEDTSATTLSLRLPEEQEDLLPYPDVFDLELYYGLASGRLSVSSSSIIRCSVDEKNVFLPGHASVLPTTRRFGYIVATHSRLSANHANDENVRPSMHQDYGPVRSSRDVYHLPIFDRRSVSTPTRPDVGTGENDDSLPVFRPRTAILATPASSSLASPGCDSGRHILLPIPLREQMQQHQRTRSRSDSALDMSPTPTHTRARSRFAPVQEPLFDTPSPLPGGPGKARTYAYTTSKTYVYGPPDIPLPPIVIVSSVSASDQSHPARNAYKDAAGCESSNFSETSDAYDVAPSEESNTSPEALRSRLQETCNNFSRPVELANTSWADESGY